VGVGESGAVGVGFVQIGPKSSRMTIALCAGRYALIQAVASRPARSGCSWKSGGSEPTAQ